MKTPNNYRIRAGEMGSDDTYGNNGKFSIPFRSFTFTVIASDGEGWEHVSVSLPKRTPNWEEMCHIKNLFWEDDECIVQYHPPKSDYVNNHEHCLHLWKQEGKTFPRPPAILVGLKEANPADTMKSILNSTKVILTESTSGARVFKLPKGSQYLKLHYENDRLTALTIEYARKGYVVNMEVSL